MTFYPDNYPRLYLHLTSRQRQWQGYRYLALDVVNPGKEPLPLYYRIDDRKDPQYADRVNGRFLVQPGVNHLRLDLEQITTSGSKRHLELDRIESLLFYQVSPEKPQAFGIDYIRLEPGSTLAVVTLDQ